MKEQAQQITMTDAYIGCLQKGKKEPLPFPVEGLFFYQRRLQAIRCLLASTVTTFRSVGA